ncbi:MAG: CDP-alcohol phosphatidyltransferase family protein [Lachnospiraceae bacterium]|nr:CDP-alcohol phosphatidyltransferase family protein [Lachnospiraceae bacterium]
MITYKQLVEKTMPPEKKASANKCIIGHYLLRPVSNVISIPLISRGVSATTVTKISGIFPIISLFMFLLFPNALGFWIGWGAILIWNILDGVDGNIARYTETCSKMGELWDAAVGWLAVIVFYIGMGAVAFFNVGFFPVPINISPSVFLVMGGISAIDWIFPRLIMQKKSVLLGEESVSDVKQRSNYSIPKLLFFNITSINGGAAVIFLLSFCLNLMGLCMIFYFILSMAVAIGSIYSLLK